MKEIKCNLSHKCLSNVFVFATRLPHKNDCDKLADQLANTLFDFSSESKKSLRYIQGAVGKVLLKYIALTRFDCSSFEVSYGKGKPYAVGIYMMNFNLSHSGEWVLCAISDKEIGVDVQQINSQYFHHSEYFFSKEEISMLQTETGVHQVDTFTELWTLKESYTKCMGLGLDIPFSSFSIMKDNEGASLFLGGKKIKTLSFYTHRLNEKYIYSICIRDCHMGLVNFEEIRIESLLKWLITQKDVDRK